MNLKRRTGTVTISGDSDSDGTSTGITLAVQVRYCDRLRRGVVPDSDAASAED
jgi:hypothetical protein